MRRARCSRARGRIATDNMLHRGGGGDLGRALRAAFCMDATTATISPLWVVGDVLRFSGVALLVLRDRCAGEAGRHRRCPRWRLIDGAMIKRLLAFGSLVLFAQLADYLYAPTDYILIKLFLGWEAVAAYTPAMTIDSGLLLLVTGLSSVILPRTAIAHTAGEIDACGGTTSGGRLVSAFLLRGGGGDRLDRVAADFPALARQPDARRRRRSCRWC